MKKKHLFWLLLPSYWILTSVAIVVVAFYAFHSMSHLYFQTLENDIRTRATLLAEQVRPLVEVQDRLTTDAICKKLGKKADTRFSVILPDGTVAGDSDEVPANMEDHGDRPEIRQALGGAVGMDRRYSRTIKQEMMYIAIPLKSENGATLCAVRAARPMTAIKSELNAMTGRVVTVAILTGLLAMVVCIVVVQRITSPLYNMSNAARQFAEGDFSRRIPAQHAIEFDQLAESLNSMSDQLSTTLTTVSEQRNEQHAVLASMGEAVLAIDKRERIIHMNRVGGEILGVNHKTTKRALMEQVVPFANLQEFIKAALSSPKPLSRDFTLIGKTERQVQANGRALLDAENNSIGALIVLRDITQLRHLETVRADFVANVSHELKTPITSIKGFVETLLSDDWNHDADIIRFLEIINQQSGRLNAIIDDLLMLSRLEQKDGLVLREPSNLLGVIGNAINLCELQAEKKKTNIESNCPDGLMLDINAPLIEQALVNLIINAIKYSDSDKTVRIHVEQQEQQVMLSICDEGFGIEPRHLERLFERFYRVDTARSRKLGGTGLGLSIVKHIVQAHDGSIRVKSKLGTGSTFIITLPTNP